MSLSVSLQTALSGLHAVQTALQVTSNNIANANTEGYTRKIVAPIPILVAGMGAGVDVSDISRQVNETLIRDMRGQLGGLGMLRVEDEFFTRMQDLFGTLSSGTSLTATVSGLAAAFEAFAAFPEDPVRGQQLVAAAQALTRQFNDGAREVQTMRADADRGITDALTVVNTQLTAIADLNDQIARDRAAGEPTAALEDQRDLALTTLAEYIDINTFERPTGETVVMTKSGRMLLDGAAPTLTHTPAAGVDVSVAYPVGFDGINLNGVDITTELTGGRIGALIAMRDTTLPNLAAELDGLANSLFDEINAIHNDGAAFPPPNALTGTRAIAGADAFAGTGTTRIAITDANGDLVAPPVELDLALYATVGDLVTAIDTALGANGSASIVGGNLVISAAVSTNGVAINENDTDIGGRGLSHHFGLNDFFTGDATVSLARNIAVRAAIVQTPALVSHTELLAAAALAGDTAVTAGGTAIGQRLAAKFDEALAYAAAGELGATTATFADYSAQILSVNAAQAAEAGDSLAFKQTLYADIKFRADSVAGVNIDEEMANLIQLQNAFAAVARVITVTSELMDTLNEIPA